MVYREPDQKYIDLIIDHFQANRHREMATEAKRLFEEFPSSAIVRLLCGVAATSLSQSNEAVEHYRETLRIQPGHPEALVNLGVELKRLNRLEEAVKYFEQAISVLPAPGLALMNVFFSLSDALIRLRRYDQAEIYLRKLMHYDLNEDDTFWLIRSLGSIAKLDARTAMVRRADSEIAHVTISAVTTGHDIEVIYDKLGTSLEPDSAASRSQAYEEIPTRLLRVTDGHCIYPNILIAGDTLIDSNNGVSTLEMAGHSQGIGVPALSVSLCDGKLTYTLREPTTWTISTHPVGILTAAENYSSWLLGELPRLALYQHASPTLPLVLHGESKAFHRDSLEACGIAGGNVLETPETSGIKARVLYFSSPTYFSHTPSFTDLEFIRDRVRRSLPMTASSDLLYVSRSRLGPGGVRTIINEEEVETFLRARGFRVIHPQEMTFIDQARAFASARRIVAPFGAALANGVFCIRNVDLCLIATKRTPEFTRLYQWLDANISYLTPHGYKVRKHMSQSSSYEYQVDIGQLNEFISHATP